MILWRGFSYGAILRLPQLRSTIANGKLLKPWIVTSVFN